MAVTITSRPGSARTTARVNVRLGAPTRTASKGDIVEAGTVFSFVGDATGESVAGNSRWYALGSERFVWSGASTEVATTDTIRPGRAMFGDHAPPAFETVAGIRHTVKGRRPHGLEGLIVHFDAYRIRRAGNGVEDSDRRTLDMMRSGQDNRFHYAEISRTGRIFVPESFVWDEWGSHAGKSLCPVTGRTWVSQFYVGFEMNNPGVLYPAQEPNVFCPWFNSRRDEAGNVILDGDGKCTRLSANDEWYSREEVRFAEGVNIAPHWYLPYSFDQFEALVNVALHLARHFPTSFKLDHVLGHDEVAPGRKSDPGGALATPDRIMTMPEFRAHLRERL